MKTSADESPVVSPVDKNVDVQTREKLGMVELEGRPSTIDMEFEVNLNIEKVFFTFVFIRNFL